MQPQKKKHFFTILTTACLLTLSIFSAGCGKADTSGYLQCPLTAVPWDTAEDDLSEIEGDDYDSYKSVYGGTTYTYSKEYLGQEGTIKYMYDGDGELVCIAWAYDGTEDEETLYQLYDEIRTEVVSEYGESSRGTDKNTNSGDVWHLDGGNILISTMITESNKALQYSYLCPKVATPAEDVQESTEDLTDLIDQNQ